MILCDGLANAQPSSLAKDHGQTVVTPANPR
jgi:hypothetical protein